MRVRFDFEARFLNGGSLAGRDIRLDIDGADIADDALAAHVIRDLRLLMVGELLIRDKRVFAEAHKRATSSVEPGFVDLSHTIEDGMVTLRGLPAPIVCEHLSFDASHAHYDDGTEFSIGRVAMVANTGTYLDTPYHRCRDGDDLARLPLDRIADVPGVVVRATGALQRAIDWTVFAATDVRDRAVLVETGWDRHWRTDAYFEGHPFLTGKAARYLVDQGARLVGIDSLNIDDTTPRARPVHSILLGAGIPIVEHLTGLCALPITGFRFWAVPPKVAGMGTFPVRAHAIVDA